MSRICVYDRYLRTLAGMEVPMTTKPMTIRLPEGGYQGALERAVQGPVARQAIYEPFALPIVVAGLLDDMRWEEPVRTQMINGLVRQGTAAGPSREGGWLSTIMQILDRYAVFWGDRVAFGDIATLYELESHGFRYDRVEDAVDCVERVIKGLERLQASLEHGPLREVIDHNRPVGNTGMDDLVFRAFAVFVHHVARTAGWDCHKSERRPPAPLAEPWVLSVVIQLGLVSMDTLVCNRCSDLHFRRTWGIATQACQCGMRAEHVDWLLERTTPISFHNVFTNMALHRFDGALYDAFCRLPDALFAQTPMLEAVRAALAWRQVGCPGSLETFITRYGTREAYEEAMAAAEQERQANLKRERDEREARLAANAPTGRKRGQPHDTSEEADEVDFEELCEAVDIRTHLPGLDERLARVILVHGLLREGDRLASFDELPTRKENKLWSQCRPYLDGSSSRREFGKVLRDLVSEGVVSTSGGKYAIARPNASFPKARGLLNHLRTLASLVAA